jgi:hypothetical protein
MIQNGHRSNPLELDDEKEVYPSVPLEIDDNVGGSTTFFGQRFFGCLGGLSVSPAKSRSWMWENRREPGSVMSRESCRWETSS